MRVELAVVGDRGRHLQHQLLAAARHAGGVDIDAGGGAEAEAQAKGIIHPEVDRRLALQGEARKGGGEVERHELVEDVAGEQQIEADAVGIGGQLHIVGPQDLAIEDVAFGVVLLRASIGIHGHLDSQGLCHPHPLVGEWINLKHLVSSRRIKVAGDVIRPVAGRAVVKHQRFAAHGDGHLQQIAETGINLAAQLVDDPVEDLFIPVDRPLQIAAERVGVAFFRGRHGVAEPVLACRIFLAEELVSQVVNKLVGILEAVAHHRQLQTIDVGGDLLADVAKDSLQAVEDRLRIVEQPEQVAEELGTELRGGEVEVVIVLAAEGAVDVEDVVRDTVAVVVGSRASQRRRLAGKEQRQVGDHKAVEVDIP